VRGRGWRRPGGRSAGRPATGLNGRRVCGPAEVTKLAQRTHTRTDVRVTIPCMDRGSLEQLLGQGLSLAEIGHRFDLHESTVSYWAKKYGLEAANRDKHAARGGLSRCDLEEFVGRGWSTRQIAEAVNRSQATVRHWLREYGLTTDAAKRHYVYAGQEQRMTLECPHHGMTEFQRRRGGGYRCLKCRSEAVTRRRRRVKQVLVEEAGGKCQACGYNRCVGALHFHHVDSAGKRFGLSHRGVARSLAEARGEAEKCVLLCSNCHVEVEAGLRQLP
jgi:transposase